MSVEILLKVIISVKGRVEDDSYAHDAIRPMFVPEVAKWATLKSRLDGSTRAVVATLCPLRGPCESSVVALAEKRTACHDEAGVMSRSRVNQG